MMNRHFLSRSHFVFCLIPLLCLLHSQPVFSSGQIVKRVSGYVLIDTDRNVGDVGEIVKVYRNVSGESKNIGAVEILKFKNGRTVAQIVKERSGFSVRPGDYLEGFESEKSVVDRLLDDAEAEPAYEPRRGTRRPFRSMSDMVTGPIPGMTVMPDLGSPLLSINAYFASAKSAYDYSGDEIKYRDLADDKGDPEYNQTIMSFDLMYLLNENLGIGINVPMVLSRGMEWNPDYGYKVNLDEDDSNGLTGIGDVTVYGKMLLTETPSSRVALHGGFKFASGSSVEDLDDEYIYFKQPTGNGNTAFKLGISTDHYTDYYILSFGLSYEINNETEFTFSEYDYEYDYKDEYDVHVKYGNQLTLTARAGYKIFPVASIGLEAAYFTAGETEEDGDKIDYSDSRAVILSPVIGYSFGTPGGITGSLFGGYAFTTSGSNVLFKSYGFTIGGLIRF